MDPTLKINEGYYAAWGSASEKSFTKWWAEKGKALFERPTVAIHTAQRATDGRVLVSVPLQMTPTDAGNAIRALLTTHYQKTERRPIKEQVYSFTEGKEVKVAAIRAYLHTYDTYQRLIAEGKRSDGRSQRGKRASDIEIRAKDLLREVRRYYLARSEQWTRRKVKVRVDTLPIALSQGMTENPHTGQKVKYEGEERAAIQSVLRYLRRAQRLVANAAKGNWPGA